MKKLLSFILTLCLCSVVMGVTSVLAAEEEKTSATEPAKINREKQIKDLRERVATKVAELKEKAKKSFSGEIKSITGTTIVLTTKQGDKTIKTSEETKFFRVGAGARKEIPLKDLTVGEKISVICLQDQEKKELEARIVIARVLPVNINGKVTAVDVKGGTITVQTPKRGSFIIDVETTTKIFVWEKGEGRTKYGFSKIKVGDRVHVNGFTPTKVKEDENRIRASRILVLPGKAAGLTEEKQATATAKPKTPKPSSKPSPKPSPTPEE